MSTLSILLASLAGLTLTPVSATPSQEVVTDSRIISFAREDLLTEEGVDALRGQIASAARRVCTEPRNLRSRMYSEYRDCAHKAYQQGIEQLEAQVADARFRNRQYVQNTIGSAQGTH